MNALEVFLSDFKHLMKKQGYNVSVKSISNGTTVSVTTTPYSFSFNLYFSQKKGISIVPHKLPKNQNDPKIHEFASEIENLARRTAGLLPLSKPAATSSSTGLKETDLSLWAGTDEAGKGDYFGPLVTAGFVMHKENTKRLAALGVRDSKDLSDPAVIAIADALESEYPDQCFVFELPPAEYNKKIDELAKQGYKLNELLGWCHSEVINRLLLKYSPEAVIIDKFGDAKTLTVHISSEIPLIIRPGAEDNPAVAAASILARAHFLKSLAQLSEESGIELPKGAGAPVDSAAKNIYNQSGTALLSKTAKIHFKTTQKIMGT